MWSFSTLWPSGGSTRTDKSALGQDDCHYPFTGVRWRTEFMRQSPSVVQLQWCLPSHRGGSWEALWSWTVSTKKGIKCCFWFKMLWAGCQYQAWTVCRGAQNIHLLKCCVSSTVSHWARRGNRTIFCRALTPSSPWFYSPRSENHLCSMLVHLLLFATLIFHYLELSFCHLLLSFWQGFHFLFLSEDFLYPHP